MTQPIVNWKEAVDPSRIVLTEVDGVPCWAFTVLKGDGMLAWDAANGNMGPGGKGNRRAEMSFAPADPRFKPSGAYNVKPGMLQTYGIRMRFKGGWPMNPGLMHDWQVEWQIHLPDNYQGNGYDGFKGITSHNGSLDWPIANDPNGGYFHQQRIQTDVWGPHDYKMAVKWSQGQDGWVKVADGNNKVLAQWNGPTFPGNNATYMYGPLIGLYMDGVSLTNDMTLYMAGFEGPLPDIWDGDKIADGSQPAPTPTPTPTPTPAPGTAGAPQWLWQDVRGAFETEIATQEASLAKLKAARDLLASKLNTGPDWLK